MSTGPAAVDRALADRLLLAWRGSSQRRTRPRFVSGPGLAADAAAAYKRVTKPKFDQLLSVYTLAQRRHAALGAAH